MELYLKITYLNDFIFCPLSIYYHQLYGDMTERLYYDNAQLDGKVAHSAIDEKRYSTHKNILQGIDVYSDEFKLCGKIEKASESTVTVDKKGIVTEILIEDFSSEEYQEDELKKSIEELVSTYNEQAGEEESRVSKS